MNEHVKRISKPRCFLLYAIAPSELPAAEANRTLNAFVADPGLPLAIFHDHFIGQLFRGDNTGPGRAARAILSGGLAGGDPALDLFAQPLRV